MIKEMKPLRRIRPECGHPMDCIWFWKDINGGIHVFCVPCMAEKLQKIAGLKIYYYQNEETFLKEIGGQK